MSDLQERLQTELSLRKSTNPRFSLRRLAGLLDMSPAHLSLFLSGKKSLSSRKVQHIADVLKIPDRVIADFVRNKGASSTGRARDAIAHLRREGLLDTVGGRLRQRTEPLRTRADVPSEAVRAYHRRNLQLAETKLEAVPVAGREFGSITFALDTRRLPALKERIRQFLDEAAAEGETPAATEVFTLAIQLFPLTTRKEYEP